MTREQIAETFDRWVEEGRADALEENHADVVRQVMERMEIRPGEKVLDLGCGNGWATRALAKASAGVQAIGIDASPRMIARADELHSFTIRARYDLGAFEELEFGDAEFDRLFSMEALYYATDLEAALREACRVLKPGAVADVVVDLYAEHPASAAWQAALTVPVHVLDEAAWTAAFQAAGFAPVTTARLLDSRGPGDEAAFEASEWYPDWATKVAAHEAGSLWIHSRKPE